MDSLTEPDYLLSDGRKGSPTGGGRLSPVIVMLFAVLSGPGVARPAPALTQVVNPVITSTTRPPSSATGAQLPTCAVPGAACGACGPVGQCLEHVDAGPPRRVCVNGGFCVQVECAADAQCPAGQVCAALGGLSACCPPCP